jgi:hypothetical protein
MYIEIIVLFTMVLLMGILNRLRGTGLIKHFGIITLPYVYKEPIKINLVWNHIYGLYLGLIVGLLTLNIGWGILALGLYILGESKGWGEWIGALSKPVPLTDLELMRQYKDNEGKKFPFIHQIANFFIKEELIGATFSSRLSQYMRYATLALFLRGIWWWLPLYLLLAYLKLISFPEAFIGVLIISIMFPINCIISRYIGFDKKIWKVQFSRGWENQEFLNGLTQGLVLWLLLLDIPIF